ncbi:MAG TPA: LysR family transcriptional regulator substrate-binding protein [Propionibacterium sp.]|nr:LysR family transcriptional regulator substrate-binding protein [Propionibacterium sp.]
MSESPAAGSPDALRVGHVPGVTLTKWRTRWAERLTARLDVAEVAEADQRRVLVDDVVDLCFVRLPIDREGLHAIPLYDEVTVAWVSKDHPVAAYDDVTLADLTDETLLTDLDAVALDRVNAGAVLLVPLSVARSASRKDLAHRPVTDAEPTTVALAWRTDNGHPLIDEFIGIVRGRTANSSRTQAERAAKPKGAPVKSPGGPGVSGGRTRRSRSGPRR